MSITYDSRRSIRQPLNTPEHLELHTTKFQKSQNKKVPVREKCRATLQPPHSRPAQYILKTVPERNPLGIEGPTRDRLITSPFSKESKQAPRREKCAALSLGKGGWSKSPSDSRSVSARLLISAIVVCGELAYACFHTVVLCSSQLISALTTHCTVSHTQSCICVCGSGAPLSTDGGVSTRSSHKKLLGVMNSRIKEHLLLTDLCYCKHLAGTPLQWLGFERVLRVSYARLTAW
jgi:hypothetical protein